MSYWLPKVCLGLMAVVAAALSFFSVASDDVAHTLMIVVAGLALFSLTLNVFPSERS